MAKVVSLLVKIGAVAFVLALPQAYAIQLQLLGGIWIIQLLPAILLGLYTRWCNAKRLDRRLGGRACAWHLHGRHPRLCELDLPAFGFGFAVPGYAALYSVALNFLLAIGLTPIFDRAVRQAGGGERASPARDWQKPLARLCMRPK